MSDYSSKPFLSEDGSLVTYREYLLTDLWRQKRSEAFGRCGGKCQLCGTSLKRHGDKWQAHHNNYRNLGCERPADLIVLCIPCHKDFHRRKDAEKERARGKRGRWKDARPVMLTASERKRSGRRPDIRYRQAGLR